MPNSEESSGQHDAHLALMWTRSDRSEHVTAVTGADAQVETRRYSEMRNMVTSVIAGA